MNVIRFNEAENYEPEKEWKRVSLCNQKDISIEHFVKPANHVSPWHDHENAQVLIVLEGKLKIKTENEEQTLSKGDTVYIEGGDPHIVINPLDTPSIGIDIFVS